MIVDVFYEMKRRDGHGCGDFDSSLAKARQGLSRSERQ